VGLGVLLPEARAVTVATVGDSFADAIYLALRSRPDLMKKNDVHALRWSRPVIGLTRTEQFDYAHWLSTEGRPASSAEVCIVQIGSNDMQAIKQDRGWVAFGSEPWKAIYRQRVNELADLLRGRLCQEVIWILQPSFERRKYMADRYPVVNAVQMDALKNKGILVFNITAHGNDYADDDTHFGRDFILKVGDAIFALSSRSRELHRNTCFTCHEAVPIELVLKAKQELFPLTRCQGQFLRPAVSITIPLGE